MCSSVSIRAVDLQELTARMAPSSVPSNTTHRSVDAQETEELFALLLQGAPCTTIFAVSEAYRSIMLYKCYTLINLHSSI